MKKIARTLLYLSLTAVSLYGLGRLYFEKTGGFQISNISSDFAFNPEWEVRPLTQSENQELAIALNQPYRYLGKGCQAYVFSSEDNRYVIKFFKYQRFRLQPWLNYFPPLPAVEKYRQEKLAIKWKKLDGFVKSWKIVCDHLKEEAGLVYVHLNKTDHLKTSLEIYDKIGIKHVVDLDKMEFCVQRKAEMLSQKLLELKKEQNLPGAIALIDKLLNKILLEYSRGVGDNDHALMQNTGVVDGEPIHIDVGQFIKDEKFLKPEVVKQEFFTKTYRFKLWVKEHYPELFAHLEARLKEIIGPEYETLKPKYRKHWSEQEL